MNPKQVFHFTNNRRFPVNRIAAQLDASRSASYSGTGTNWNDISGNGLVATLNGPTYSSADGGQFVFDGVNDYAIINNRTMPSSFLNCSIGGFFKKTTGVSQTLLSLSDTSSVAKYFNLFIDANGYLTATRRYDDQVSISRLVVTTTTQIVPNNQWFSAHADFRSDRCIVYYNGQLIFNDTTSFGVTDIGSNLLQYNDILIGVLRTSSPSAWFNGSVGEIGVWNKSIESFEVYNHFITHKSRYGL